MDILNIFVGIYDEAAEAYDQKKAQFPSFHIFFCLACRHTKAERASADLLMVDEVCATLGEGMMSAATFVT